MRTSRMSGRGISVRVAVAGAALVLVAAGAAAAVGSEPGGEVGEAEEVGVTAPAVGAEDAFGQEVSADAQDGGVDGQQIAQRARERAQERRAEREAGEGGACPEAGVCDQARDQARERARDGSCADGSVCDPAGDRAQDQVGDQVRDRVREHADQCTQEPGTCTQEQARTGRPGSERTPEDRPGRP